jgi:hypothetical protein
VEDNADLRFAQFTTIDIPECRWPEDPAAFRLEGITFQHASAAAKEPESHQKLLELANKSAYAADVYGSLEAFFLRQGYRADADAAFIAGKCRERKEYLHNGDWVKSWLLYGLVGYGRHPEQAGYLCLAIIALGCVLFPLKKMELQDPDDANDPDELLKRPEKRHVYNRFWYSFGLFLPFVNLQTAEQWKPKKKHAFLRNYVRVHILLGWILIPILLAAVSGLIK